MVADFPQKFSKWVIDLRAVGVNPQALDDKSEFIQRVQQWLAGNEGSLQALQLTIGASDHQQYHKGL